MRKNKVHQVVMATKLCLGRKAHASTNALQLHLKLNKHIKHKSSHSIQHRGRTEKP